MRLDDEYLCDGGKDDDVALAAAEERPARPGFLRRLWSRIVVWFDAA